MKLKGLSAVIAIIILGSLAFVFQSYVFPSLTQEEIIKKAGDSIIEQIKFDLYADQVKLLKEAGERGNQKKMARKLEKQRKDIDKIKIVSIKSEPLGKTKRNVRFNIKSLFHGKLTIQGSYLIKVDFTLGSSKSIRSKVLELNTSPSKWTVFPSHLSF